MTHINELPANPPNMFPDRSAIVPSGFIAMIGPTIYGEGGSIPEAIVDAAEYCEPDEVALIKTVPATAALREIVRDVGSDVLHAVINDGHGGSFAATVEEGESYDSREPVPAE